jgi:hypothetical protein
MDHVVERLWRIVRMHPGGPWHAATDAARVLARCLHGPVGLRAWVGRVEAHQRVVAGGPDVLRLSPGAQRLLWQATPEGRRLELKLARRGGFGPEGQLHLRLFDAGACVAQLGFTLGCSGEEKVVHAHAARVEPAAFGLAAALGGMPADEFLRAAFSLLCGCLGVTQVIDAHGTAFDAVPLELDIPLDPQARERQALLARVHADIGRACGLAYAPTSPLVHLHEARRLA